MYRGLFFSAWAALAVDLSNHRLHIALGYLVSTANSYLPPGKIVSLGTYCEKFTV